MNSGVSSSGPPDAYQDRYRTDSTQQTLLSQDLSDRPEGASVVSKQDSKDVVSRELELNLELQGSLVRYNQARRKQILTPFDCIEESSGQRHAHTSSIDKGTGECLSYDWRIVQRPPANLEYMQARSKTRGCREQLEALGKRHRIALQEWSELLDEQDCDLKQSEAENFAAAWSLQNHVWEVLKKDPPALSRRHFS